MTFLRAIPCPGVALANENVRCAAQTSLARRSFSAGGCSMKITEDVRKYAAERGIEEEQALQPGLEQKSCEFSIAGAKKA